MTNTIAIVILFLIGGFFALDHYVLQWNAPLEAMRLMAGLIEYVAFWR